MAIPVITSATHAGGNRSSAFSYTITASNTPTSFDAFLPAGGLPAGLSVDTVTGIISGTPTASAIVTIHIQATNASGTGSANLELHISRAGAPVITSAYTAAAVVGTPFTYTITATNTPLGFAASTLPAGLSVNTSTGAITGTPTTAGAFTAHISATNASGNDNVSLVFTVTAGAGAPVITSALSVMFLLGNAEGYQITATNTPTSFGASNLPPGMTVNTTTGLISGIPTIAGTYSSPISATNGSGTGTATVAFNVESSVGGQPIIPSGVAVLVSLGQPIDARHLANANLDIMSLSQSWERIERTQGLYDFSYFENQISAAAAAGKSVTLRVVTGGGSRSAGGSTPDYVFTQMGLDPNSKTIIPGVNYTFNLGAAVISIPVFWDTHYIAAKTALYTALGNWITNTTNLTDPQKAAVLVIHGSFANGVSEDWYVPHGTNVETTGGPDGTGYPINEESRWLFATNAAPNPGAGYTTAKMVTAGTGLLQALLNSCPGKTVIMSVGQNGTALDNTASSGTDTTNYLAKTVATAISFIYPERMALQRDDASAFMPLDSASTGTTYQLIHQWAALGLPTAAADLWFIFNDATFRMNNGVSGDVSTIFRTTGEHAASYGLAYLEIWEQDALRQSLVDQVYVRSLFFSGTLPDPPAITSAVTADAIPGQPFTYQITATNNPISYGLSGTETEFRVDPITGIITGHPLLPEVVVATISATNNGGTGSATLTITVATGDGSSGGGPPGGALVAVSAFPEVTSFSEATRPPCPNYVALLAQQAPNPPSNLVVTTPMRPGSGIATATWTAPLL